MPASLKLLMEANKMDSIVFAKWPGDQRYYTATVLEIDEKTKQCKIKYEDGHQCWTDTKDMHLQLAIDDLEDEHIICCVCDSGHSKAPNEIIICDVCQQGYHVKCHQPAIDREEDNLDDVDAEWNCSACKYLLKQDVQPLSTPPKSVKKASIGGKLAKPSNGGHLKPSSSPKSLASSQSPKSTPVKRTKMDQKSKSTVKKSSKKAPPSSQAKIKLTKVKKGLEKPNEKQSNAGLPQDVTMSDNCNQAGQAETRPAIIDTDNVNKMEGEATLASEEEVRKSIKGEKVDLASNVAQVALVEKVVNIDTSEFVGLISPGESSEKVSIKQKSSRARKPSSKVAATNVPAAAAAY